MTHSLVYIVFMIAFAFVCMGGSVWLALEAWLHKDLRASDVAQAVMSVVVYGVTTWVLIMR